LPYLELMRFQMKPVILITLHRRYHELEKTINNLISKKRFFKECPSIYVIWADPEPCRYWFLDDLVKTSKIEGLITRHVLPEENGKNPTSFYESHNIRIGLETIFRKYPNSYCIVQASDVLIKEYAIHLIQEQIFLHANAVVFYWSNKYNPYAFHTNFFAVTSDSSYWPPFADFKTQDVLERLWYKNLESKNLLNKIFKYVNHNETCFMHEHISESLKEFVKKSVFHASRICLNIKGHLSFHKIILNFFRCIFLGDCNGKNNC